MPGAKTRLFAVPIALWVIFSQINCSSECDGVNRTWYQQLNWQLIAVDNRGKEPVPATANKAPMHAFGLGILYASRITAFREGLDCGLAPQIYPFEGVTDVRITCLQDFDASHPAGVSLNDCFKELTYTPTTHIPSYTAVSGANLNNYSKTNYEVDFIMVQPPAHPGDYQFNVRLFFKYGPNNDSTYTTPVITLY